MPSFFRTPLLLLLAAIPVRLAAQEPLSDTLRTLDSVQIRAFESLSRRSSSANAVTVTDFKDAERFQKTSLVHGFNTVPGVRMEERSPGSYRLNIRGSSLRSPFGVRNVKVYWNGIPLTDAGGNTYFNQLTPTNFSYAELFKGPAGSVYGAGTGGLVLLENFSPWKPGLSLETMTGSYGLFNVFATARWGGRGEKGQPDIRNIFTYTHNRSDGYREQSALRRHNASWQSRMQVSDRHSLTASVLFTDMYYETPGGLTRAEYEARPRAARPATGSFPSAVNARAAIEQKNILAGLTSQTAFSPSFRWQTTLFGVYNQVKNAAIRNYERRKEPGYGGRTVLTWKKDWDEDNSGKAQQHLQWVTGAEWQQGLFNTLVSGNRNGQPDTVQTNDDIRFTTGHIFLQGEFNFRDEWLIQGGISLNRTAVSFTRLNRYPVITQNRRYRNELAPRLVATRRWTNGNKLGFSIARGFSPPTIGEMLPSTGIIATDLEAEYGWNYEFNSSWNFFHSRLRIDADLFLFRLKNALVQRRDAAGADFFTNAGWVNQQGAELRADYFLWFRGTPALRLLRLNAGFAWHPFRYGDFRRLNEDYSGNRIPSVPVSAISLLADLLGRRGWYAQATWFYTGRLFLNDANTATANAWHLLGMRLGWKLKSRKGPEWNGYAGVDNLLNQLYSLGHDINAAGGRFYNAAPGRNVYLGLSWQIAWKKQPVQ